MTTEMLFLVCTMLNAFNVANGYSATKLITYADYITHGQITKIDVWALSEKLMREANPDSLSYKRGKELRELHIYGWYIPTETLINEFTSIDQIALYDLAGYILTDQWKIKNEYEVAKQLEHVTC